MTNLKNSVAIKLCLSLCIALSSFSQAKNSDKSKAPRIEMKCYVELVGGINTIYRVVLPSNKLAGLTDRLIGKKIPVVGTKKKQKIYKVIECVGYKEPFISSMAKSTEKNTAG